MLEHGLQSPASHVRTLEAVSECDGGRGDGEHAGEPLQLRHNLPRDQANLNTLTEKRETRAGEIFCEVKIIQLLG